ncbi:PH domain-containing protein [Alteribacillus sp. HJP-4]|uniref:PH domain-containing protein n=1 Tax=Alteribacillus sp. HJP-4 TaxID=2775394 RepID=UPI0035CD2287
MSEPKRLHPAAVVFQLITILKQSIYAAIPLVVLTIGNGHALYFAGGLAVLVIILIIFSILSWLRFSYTIEGDQLRIEKGVIIRQNRYISNNRIQSIDLTQGVLHRIFKLTKVQIETAGSDKSVDASLSAVTFEEGQRVQNELKRKKEMELPEEEKEAGPEKEFPSFKISLKRLFVAGSTSGSVGVILGLAAVGFNELESLIPNTVYDQTTRWVLALAFEAVIGLVVLILLLLYLIGILGTVIKYGKFTITRYEKELFITRGLLEKRQMTIPLKRIQAVGIKESLIRQPFGFATIYVEIAGGETGKNAGSSTLLFPIIRKKEIREFLHTIMPEYEEFPETFLPAPKRAIPYYIVRSAWFPFLLFLAIFIFFPAWAYLPGALLTIAVLMAVLTWRSTGYNLEPQQLTVRLRNFSKDTVMLKHRRIQAFEKKQHILHQKQQLGSLRLSILNNVLGRHYLVKEIEEKDADRLGDWYSFRDKDIQA